MAARSLHALPHNYATKSHGLEHHRVPVVSECHRDRARQVATQQPGLKPSELYGTIWVVLHFLLHAVYICQKSLNFTYAFKCYQQNCSWLHFTWTTLYITGWITEQHPVCKKITVPVVPEVHNLIKLPVVHCEAGNGHPAFGFGMP